MKAALETGRGGPASQARWVTVWPCPTSGSPAYAPEGCSARGGSSQPPEPRRVGRGGRRPRCPRGRPCGVPEGPRPSDSWNTSCPRQRLTIAPPYKVPETEPRPIRAFPSSRDITIIVVLWWLSPGHESTDNAKSGARPADKTSSRQKTL